MVFVSVEIKKNLVVSQYDSSNHFQLKRYNMNPLEEERKDGGDILLKTVLVLRKIKKKRGFVEAIHPFGLCRGGV